MQRIHRGRATDVYRTQDGGVPVIIKALRGPYPSRDDLDAFEREVRVTQRVQGDGVVRLLRVDRSDEMPRMVLEDFGAHALSMAFRAARPAPELVLRLARTTLDTLAHVHDQRVVHKDVNPSNLVWNAQTGELKLIDFGIAIESVVEESRPSELIEGTLPFIAPEQTGRLVDRVGPRSDFYSLGATLYALLTGRPPFELTDTLSLVHAHVAVRPKPIHEVDPSLPEDLSAIVQKLLEKRPDDRYQSADGLRADLESAGSERPRGQVFVPGRHDVVRELRVPETLFGRQHELRSLVRTVRSGGLLVIGGASGVGKSALVQAARRELATSSIRVVGGKFDRYRSGIPYAAVIAALRELVRQVLSEDEEELVAFRSAMADALGPNARLLAEFIPELEALLGRLPPLPSVPPAESENRFLRTLARFTAAASSVRRPLAIFLDDLQWADASTLRLLRAIRRDESAGDDEPQGTVAIIGTCRTDEVGPEHPLAPWLEQVETLALSALRPADVRALFRATVAPTPCDVDALVDAAVAKTRGNPLFLHRFLRELVDEEILVHTGEAGWVFDVDEVARLDVSDNVVRFLADKIERLPTATRGVLEVAAVLGDEFSLEDVAALREEPIERVLDALHPATAEDIVVAQRRDRWFRFAHDRVRQAARDLTAADVSSAWHVAFGRLLWARGDADIFQLVGHLGRGVDLLGDEERRRLVSVQLSAGRQALESVAYGPALSYFDAALELADAGQADARRDARLGAAQAAYLSGDRRRMDSEVELLCRSDDPLVVAAALQIRMRARISASELNQAVDVGLDALRRLGVPLDASPSKLRVAAEFASTRMYLRKRAPESHVDDGELIAPQGRMALELLAELAPPAYMARPALVPSIGFAMAKMVSDHGVNSTASYGLALYALVLCALGDQALGARYADVAEALGDRFPDARMKCRRAQLIQGFVRHWHLPILDVLPTLAEGFELGVESGDFVWASFCAQMYTNQAFLGGRELVTLRGETERYVEAIENLGQQHVLGMTEVYARAIRRLTGTSKASDLDDAGMLDLIGESNDTGCALFHVLELMVAVLEGRREDALGHARQASPRMDALPATITVPIFVTYEALAFVDAASTPAKVAGAMARCEVARRRLARWANGAPANFASHRWLIEAELARLGGRRSAALRAYDRAIARARDHHRMTDLALANERAAAYQAELGNERLSLAYLREAAFAYARWGASSKVAALVSLHPEAAPTPAASPDSRSTQSTSSERLDATAVVRASQALSEQLVLDELVCTLVRIAREVGGGTRAALVTVEGDALRLEAAAKPEEGVERYGVDLPPEGLTTFSLPLRVMQYVMRTSTDVVLSDASAEGMFTEDAHVRSHRSRSLMCLPVSHKGETRAILYLENDVHRGAFTPERLEVIRLLTAQAAISLENAALYARMEESLRAQVALTTAHSRFVPHQFLQALDRESITDVALGDHVEKEMSILFSDIRGFTSIVENLSPAENIAFINEYLSVMEPAIIESGGFVDSYIGDAIMALFDGGADDAVAAGVRMHEGLRDLNERRAERRLPPVRCGVGINTGALMLGTIGGETNLKCGVIGDSVNLAARVEALTKYFRLNMLVSDRTLEGLVAPDRWKTRMIDRVIVVGATEPITLYEVLEAEAPERRDAKLRVAEIYTDGVDLYFDRRFAAALRRFAEVLETCPDDLVAQKYVDRCMTYVRSGVPNDWDGIVRMDSKS